MPEYDTLQSEAETITLSHYEKRTDWRLKLVRREDESVGDWLERLADLNRRLWEAYGPESLESQLSRSLEGRR